MATQQTKEEVMKKLIPLIDYVLKLESKNKLVIDVINLIISYAKFLKQKPELFMFVPCDKDGNVLEKPMGGFRMTAYHYRLAEKEYQKAKDRCLFKGASILNHGMMNYLSVNGKLIAYKHEDHDWQMEIKTLEDLTHLNLELTDKASL